MTATTPAQLRDATRIATASGAREIALVHGTDEPASATLGDYTRDGTELVSFVRPDLKVGVTTYRSDR